MCKKALPEKQMSAVEQASRWSRDLAQMRSRGPGDLQNAMRSIEREYGIDYWFQWALRYRPARFRDIGHELFLKLRDAYAAECARQRHRFEHEIAVARHVAGADHAAVREAQALVEDAPATPRIQTNVPPPSPVARAAFHVKQQTTNK